MKDHFSNQAETYAKYRPSYPPELFEHILAHVTEKELAWDCGTGNGQTAIVLSRYFKKVFATDISTKQLDHATPDPRITYANEPAEVSSLPSQSVNCITVSQALHWFNFNQYYDEVRRVAKPGCLFAAWTYSLLKIDPVTDALIQRYHDETLGPYWDTARKYVNESYRIVPFPFTLLPDPGFIISCHWNTEDLQGYLQTWSAWQQFITEHDHDPVEDLMKQVAKNWMPGEKRLVKFPIHLKMGYVE